MAVPETPITRLEQYWAAILDKIQGGGSSITVEPLTITQNGTTTAPSGKAYSPVTVSVPSPNYTETISGTLANPWGGYSASDIFSAALAKDITVYLTIHDNTNKYVLGLAPDADSATRSRRFSCVTAAASTSVGVVVAVYGSTGSLTRCENYSVSSGAAAVIEAIESTAPCTLTIIHHPLPDSE